MEYLVGYDKHKNPVLLFSDITDFEEQTVRGMVILTFTEENINYTYTSNGGTDFEEVSKAAPNFYTYEVIDEKECKKRGLKSKFSNTNVNGSSSNSNQGQKVFSTVNLGVVTLKSGKKVNITDPNDMQGLTSAEAKEVEKELEKRFKSITGQSKININKIFGGGSSSSSSSSSSGCGSGSYSSGCGGGYSSRSYGCGGGGRTGC